MHDVISIIDNFRNGSYKAFGHIMNIHIHALTFFAYKYCRNKQIAEEIVADSFTKLWERRDFFESEIKIKSFLYISTKNACLDFLRSSTSNKLKLNVELEDVHLNNDIDPLNQIIHAELIKELHEEIKKLPQRQAEVFKLSYFEGYSTEEICQELNISSNALYLAKKKATDTLKVVFSEKLLNLLTFLSIFF